MKLVQKFQTGNQIPEPISQLAERNYLSQKLSAGLPTNLKNSLSSAISERNIVNKAKFADEWIKNNPKLGNYSLSDKLILKKKLLTNEELNRYKELNRIISGYTGLNTAGSGTQPTNYGVRDYLSGTTIPIVKFANSPAKQVIWLPGQGAIIQND